MSDAPQPQRPSNPGTARVFNAARQSPLPRSRQGPIKERLVSTAEDTALNAMAIVRERVHDFRRASRFLKYKAGIISAWAALSLLTAVAACPGSVLTRENAIGARLVVAGEVDRPVYMLVNDGERAWADVTVIVNGSYRAAIPEVRGAGGSVTLTPRQLIGEGGELAPLDLVIQQLEVRTARGQALLDAR